ncbi:MAG: hypothetical protein AAGH79_15735 [Bacteroidota bacterium]
MDPDILYWSVMGLSRPYNLFLGGLEVLGACLLFFRRTAFFGALLSVGILLNIVAINFAYDISVKVYSIILLTISLYLASPELPRLWSNQWQITSHQISKYWTTGLQTVVICLLLFDSLQPYLMTQNYNDDRAERPQWHGSYTLEENAKAWVRVHVHRQGYLILESADGQQRNVQGNGPGASIFESPTTRYVLSSTVGDTLLLTVQEVKDTFSLKATPLPWRDMPALQSPFHWRVD